MRDSYERYRSTQEGQKKLEDELAKAKKDIADADTRRKELEQANASLEKELASSKTDDKKASSEDVESRPKSSEASSEAPPMMPEKVPDVKIDEVRQQQQVA